jgi:hypothetical protein
MSKNVPGFTADQSLYTSRHYYSMAMSSSNVDLRGVIFQLNRGVFRRRSSGVFGTIEDYWICKQACESAYSTCLESCEGSGSLHCVTCDEDYGACLDGCSRDIA